MTKSASGGCDQFETSPEAIDQELRTALCERSHRIDVAKLKMLFPVMHFFKAKSSVLVPFSWPFVWQK